MYKKHIINITPSLLKLVKGLGILLLFIFFSACEKEKLNVIPSDAKTLAEMQQEVKNLLIAPKADHVWITNAVPVDQDFRAYSFEFMANNRVKTSIYLYSQIPLVEEMRAAVKHYDLPDIPYRNTDIGIWSFIQNSYYNDPQFERIRNLFRLISYGFGAINDQDLINSIAKKGMELDLANSLTMFMSNFSTTQYLGLKSRIIPIFQINNEIPYTVNGPISTNLAFSTQSILSDAKEFKTFDFDFNVMTYSPDSVVLKAAAAPLPNKEVVLKPISKRSIEDFCIASYYLDSLQNADDKIYIKINDKEAQIYIIASNELVPRTEHVEYFRHTFKQTLNFEVPSFGFKVQKDMPGNIYYQFYKDLPELENVSFLRVNKVKDPYVKAKSGDVLISLEAFKKGAKSEADKLPIKIEFIQP